MTDEETMEFLTRVRNGVRLWSPTYEDNKEAFEECRKRGLLEGRDEPSSSFYSPVVLHLTDAGAKIVWSK